MANLIAYHGEQETKDKVMRCVSAIIKNNNATAIIPLLLNELGGKPWDYSACNDLLGVPSDVIELAEHLSGEMDCETANKFWADFFGVLRIGYNFSTMMQEFNVWLLGEIAGVCDLRQSVAVLEIAGFCERDLNMNNIPWVQVSDLSERLWAEAWYEWSKGELTSANVLWAAVRCAWSSLQENRYQNRVKLYFQEPNRTTEAASEVALLDATMATLKASKAVHDAGIYISAQAQQLLHILEQGKGRKDTDADIDETDRRDADGG